MQFLRLHRNGENYENYRGYLDRFHCNRERHLRVDVFVSLHNDSEHRKKGTGMDIGFWWGCQKETTRKA
jgi:hypothetical protein